MRTFLRARGKAPAVPGKSFSRLSFMFFAFKTRSSLKAKAVCMQELAVVYTVLKSVHLSDPSGSPGRLAIQVLYVGQVVLPLLFPMSARSSCCPSPQCRPGPPPSPQGSCQASAPARRGHCSLLHYTAMTTIYCTTLHCQKRSLQSAVCQGPWMHIDQLPTLSRVVSCPPM